MRAVTCLRTRFAMPYKRFKPVVEYGDSRAARRPPITRRLGMLSHRLPQTLRRGASLLSHPNCPVRSTLGILGRAVASHAARCGCATALAALPSNETGISSPRIGPRAAVNSFLDSRSTPGRTIAHRRKRPHEGNSPADVRRARLFARDRPHELGSPPRTACEGSSRMGAPYWT